MDGNRDGGILIVCAANVCRSPMAGLTLRRAFARLPDYDAVPVATAGVSVERVIPAVQWAQGSKYVYIKVLFAQTATSAHADTCEVRQVSISRRRLLIAANTEFGSEASMAGGKEYFLDFMLGGKINTKNSTWKRGASGQALSLKLRKKEKGTNWENVFASEDPHSTDESSYTYEQVRPQHVTPWVEKEAKLHSAKEAARRKHTKAGDIENADGTNSPKKPAEQKGDDAEAKGPRRMKATDEATQPNSIWETEGLKEQFESLAAEHDLAAKGKMGIIEFIDVLRDWMPWRWNFTALTEAGDADSRTEAREKRSETRRKHSRSSPSVLIGAVIVFGTIAGIAAIKSNLHRRQSPSGR